MQGAPPRLCRFHLLPPLSPALLSKRLLALSLRDLRRLFDRPRSKVLHTTGRAACTAALRLCRTKPSRCNGAQLVAALFVGTEIIHLRRIAPQLGFVAELDSALDAFARGDSAAATIRLLALDQRLFSLSEADPQNSLLQRHRGEILAICDALVRHRAYFDAGGIRLKFVEVNLLGVYVAPISLLMIAAWLITVVLRTVAAPLRLAGFTSWHPALFLFAVYMIILSSLVVIIAR